MERSFKGIWIPKDIWLNEKLTLLEKVFLVEIDSLDNDEGCFASNEYFANFFKLSKNRCSEIIKSLEKKGLVKIDYKYKENSKQIEKRIIKVFEKSKGGTRNIEGGIRDIDRGTRNIEGGYSENWEDNNTYINNTVNNIFNNSMHTYDQAEKIKELKVMYEKNIGLITGMTAQYIMDMSEIIEVDLFKKAIEIANDRGVCTLGYIKGIINRWLSKNITTLSQAEAYELQKQQQFSQQKGTNNNGISTGYIKPVTTEIPVDDEKDEEYYRLLEHCRRISEEI